MLRILLVDDEPLVLIGLQGMLEWEKLGYTVCGTARNGKLALELIEREKPDIVIADVKMPVMDGLTLARTCRERSALPAFIMLTRVEEFDYINQARREGMSKHEAIIDAGRTRLRPILMTAMTTILAMFTSAIGIGDGSDMIKPMAIAIIGGLVYGTILTLIVIPCIYDAFNREKSMVEEEL